MDKKDRIKEGKNTWLRRLPLLGMLALMLFVGFRVRGVTVEDVLNYTPKNLWAASAAMLAAYAVEPLLIIFPVMVLYFATGLILPPLWAVTVGGARHLHQHERAVCDRPLLVYGHRDEADSKASQA